MGRETSPIPIFFAGSIKKSLQLENIRSTNERAKLAKTFSQPKNIA